MSEKSLYEKYLEDPEFERLMVQEDLIMDVTESFCELLNKKKMKRSDLANMMGKTKGFISQLLSGSRNMTLRSLADIAYHLGYNVKVAFQDRIDQVSITDFSEEEDFSSSSSFSISKATNITTAASYGEISYSSSAYSASQSEYSKGRVWAEAA